MHSEALLRHYSHFIRNAFLLEGGWRYAQSLYIIGGFARGEGTIEAFGDRLRIYNDFDCLVVPSSLGG